MRMLPKTYEIIPTHIIIDNERGWLEKRPDGYLSQMGSKPVSPYILLFSIKGNKFSGKCAKKLLHLISIYAIISNERGWLEKYPYGYLP